NNIKSYLILKFTIPEKYNLIYQLFLHSLTDYVYEKESGLLNILYEKELEVLNLIINAQYANKIENMPPKLPRFLLEQTYGLLLIKKIKFKEENISVLNDEAEM